MYYSILYSIFFIGFGSSVTSREGMHKYTSYRVDVRPATSMGQPIDMMATQSFTAVLRRYSDFLWLYEKLQQERAGAAIV
jgi:sorting nexin-1/2